MKSPTSIDSTGKPGTPVKGVLVNVPAPVVVNVVSIGVVIAELPEDK
jgi:hypothetical protein